jgi:U3 small nucleolar RNA-associated protein 22
VKVDYAKLRKVDLRLGQLKSFLSSLESEEVSASDYMIVDQEEEESSTSSSPIGVDYLSGENVSFLFKKPSRIEIIGSFGLKTQTKPILNLDVAVEIPLSSFKDKDLINHKYNDKRLLYLQVLKKKLMEYQEIKMEEDEDDDEEGKKQKKLKKQKKRTTERKGDLIFHQTKLDLFRNDVTKPILSINPEGIKQFVIRLIPSISKNASSSLFPLQKLLPAHNNVRPTLLEPISSSSSSSSQNLKPTPHYNNALLEDLYFCDHTALLRETIGNNTNLIDGILLLKVWLRQRGMTSSSSHTFSGFLISMLLVHLLSIRKVSKQMSSYQVFRLLLEFLSKKDTFSQPIVMHSTNSSTSLKLTPEVWSLLILSFLSLPSISFFFCLTLSRFSSPFLRTSTLSSWILRLE